MSLNPRSCAASSMTDCGAVIYDRQCRLNPRSCAASSMTYCPRPNGNKSPTSQSAFVRGFIDDRSTARTRVGRTCLNPRSCAASSMTPRPVGGGAARLLSQSAFVRGFIDDVAWKRAEGVRKEVSIRVRARLHR